MYNSRIVRRIESVDYSLLKHESINFDHWQETLNMRDLSFRLASPRFTDLISALTEKQSNREKEGKRGRGSVDHIV